MSEVAQTSLVIDSRKLLRMVMDGPALKVVMQSKSPMLFPLRRLRCIHIIGIPVDGMEALLSCAEQQVLVAFFHFNGRLRCSLHPAVAEPAMIDHWLEHVEFDPQVGQMYADWLLHQGLYVLSRLGINTGMRESRSQWVHETLRALCRQKLGREQLQSALDWLDGLLRFQLEPVISAFGFVQPRGRRKLLADIKPIFDLWMLQALAAELEQCTGFHVTPQSMTTFYQRLSSDVEYSSRRMLTQLVNGLEALV